MCEVSYKALAWRAGSSDPCGSEAMERLHFSERAVQGMDGHRGRNRTNFSIFHPTVPLGEPTRWLSFFHSLPPHFMLYLKLNIHIQ